MSMAVEVISSNEREALAIVDDVRVRIRHYAKASLWFCRIHGRGFQDLCEHTAVLAASAPEATAPPTSAYRRKRRHRKDSPA